MNDMNCGIYQIRDVENGKCYFGSSKDLKKRRREHFRMLRNNIHQNQHLQSSYIKHGKEAFIFDVVYECNEVDLLKYEQLLLDYNFKECDGGYNLAKHADSVGRGKVHTNETRKKMSKAKSGRNNPMYGTKRSEEVKRAVSNANKGRVFSKESLKKMSDVKKGSKNSFYGKRHSEETKRKISETKRRNKCQ